tara:strand:+ start:473 stop:583 length:111 start_codon:yes stop_codon:yes gene_type:complete
MVRGRLGNLAAVLVLDAPIVGAALAGVVHNWLDRED